ncbi:MAG: patatin-like protein [Bacteroidota bacterium]|jgi:patatin-like phospholipase/acyl hydrolase|nr:patatin-like protein [Bacteroidota bacterium]
MPELLRILSIDGGGIRGILSAEVLAALENKLQSKTNNSNARLAHYFDFFAGTSTGGILTCLYLCPAGSGSKLPCFSAKAAAKLYSRHGRTIFSNPGDYMQPGEGGIKEKYSSEHLERLLKKKFEHIKLSELLKPCIIPAYNIAKRSTHFFTQHDAKASRSYDYVLKDVALAASAAPAYFPPARITSLSGDTFPLVDGGVFANNPALCAYAEVHKQFGKNCTDVFMLSIGTGSTKKEYDYDPSKGWGNHGWIAPSLDILLSGANDTIDFALQQIFDSQNAGQNYFRIDPSMEGADTELDNASAENIEALRLAGIATVKKYDQELDRIAEILIKRSIE